MKAGEGLPREFYRENRNRFHERMDDYSAAIFFAGEAPYKSGGERYTFSPNRSFLYLTGIEAQKVIYLAVKTPGKTEETLFIERVSPMKEKWVGRALSAAGAAELSGIESVGPLDGFWEAVTAVMLSGKVRGLYLDLENADGRPESREPIMFWERFRRSWPAVNLSDGGKIVEELRGIKSDAEIECIKRAVDITKLAFEHIINSIAPGMYEYQIESCFDFALKFNGVRESAFNSVIAGGKNACVLHYSENRAKLADGELALFDFGATCCRYAADISRTIPVNGRFTERQRELYNIVLEAQQKALDAVRPGVTLLELNQIVVEHYKRALKQAGIINKNIRGTALLGLIEKFYWHKAGHALGLDVHDCSPKRDAPLKPGMVITVEPGLYLEREGIGIRIEDDILVTENGYVNLSASIPKTVEELEKAFEDARAAEA